jgi:hypothetical protein
MANYSDYLCQEFSKQGSPFSSTELQAAAKLYNMPIIWKEIVMNAYTLEGNRQDPIYIHSRGMLVHKS